MEFNYEDAYNIRDYEQKEVNEVGRTVTALRWTARIWSLVSLGFVLLFFVGSILVEPHDASPKFTEWGEFALFPSGVLVGIFLAWKYEGIGSLISILCLLTFYLVEWSLKGRFPGGPFFALLAMPAFLFFVCYALRRFKKSRKTLRKL